MNYCSNNENQSSITLHITFIVVSPLNVIYNSDLLNQTSQSGASSRTKIVAIVYKIVNIKKFMLVHCYETWKDVPVVKQ